MARMVNCVKLGREAEGLDFPPVPGELGKRIWENVSKEAWAGWLKHQTMLVNENRLNLAAADIRQREIAMVVRGFGRVGLGDGLDAQNVGNAPARVFGGVVAAVKPACQGRRTHAAAFDRNVGLAISYTNIPLRKIAVATGNK